MFLSLSTHFKEWLVFLACWLLLVGVQAYALRGLGLSWEEALVDSGLSNGLLASACLLIRNVLQHYRPSKDRYLYVLVWCFLLTGLWGVASYQGLQVLLGADAEYVSLLWRSLPVRLGFGFLVIGWMTLLSMLWYTQLEEKKQQQRQAQAEQLAREVELTLLRQQLHPHFLFNSLNSISALVGTRPEEARKMIYQLSDFLRGTIKKDTEQWVPLQDEWQHLQLYLDIEKVRFGHRLDTRIEADDTCQGTRLPPMLLQPVVENAIKFGLYDTTGAVTITIRAACADQVLTIEIQNPFDPHTARPRQGAGFGLSGIQRRLYLLFARHDLFQTKVEGNLFTTLLRIPQL
jgi:two-component system LytT family sensor kinase